jgi:phosphopantothenoylcysteine decarboxylase / phosphopantothenate---cysteine ligase
VAMRDAVLARLAGVDILIAAAAVADFRPAKTAAEKIKKRPGEQGLTLELVRTPDILAEVADQRRAAGWPRVVVGFAAETQDLLENASAKLKAKQLDLIVANDVTQPGSGFGSDENRVTLLYRDGRQEPLELMPKADVADRVVRSAVSLLPDEATSSRSDDDAAPGTGR